MPVLTTIGTDTLVNTGTADGQISPRVVALADGKFMVIWVGPVVLPVVPVNGTIAPSYANADIRAQIYNADGTRSGGEIVINTTTAGAQLRPVVTQLSDGHVLVTWHDGVGPSGGSAEITPNTIRAQEFDSAGVASGAEFVIGNSNGRAHSVAATANGGFVVTYQEGGVGGALAIGSIVAQVYNSSNVQTSNFVVDNTQPLATTAYVAVEADGDIVVAWQDRSPSLTIQGHVSRFNASGTELFSGTTIVNYTGAAALATGGSVVVGYIAFPNQPIQVYAEMVSADGSLSRSVLVAEFPTLVGLPTITPLANGGFLASWVIDSDPGTGVNTEIMARAFNAIGNPIGEAFQINAISTLGQSSPAFAQLTNGDLVAAWVDESQLNGDTSGTGINLRRIDYDPVNRAPTASDLQVSIEGAAPGTSVTVSSDDIDGLFGPDGYDVDGDPLVLSGVGNAANGTVVLNPDGSITVNATPGAPGPLTFDYTISDGQGGFATARVTVTFPTDFVTMRVGDIATIDFLANDFYTPAPGATGFTVTLPGPMMGGSVEGFTTLVNTANGLRIVYDPLAPTFGPVGSVDLNSSFFNLVVGQTAQYQFFYYNNQVFDDVQVTLQGWAQLGGTAADNLVGTALADHLSGGEGAANTLTGGAGNDWYTVAVVGDTIIEQVGEGIDSVRTALASFVLPDNVENLRFYGFNPGTTVGTGNALDNYISGGNFSSELYGLGGNDTLIGNGLFVGGAGADKITGAASNIDTSSYSDSPGAVMINLATNVNSGADAQGDTLFSIERVIGSAFADSLTGSSPGETLEGGDGDDMISGAAGSDTLKGGAGDDVLIGGADFDTIDGGDGANDEVRYAGNLADYSIARSYNPNSNSYHLTITGNGAAAADSIDDLRNVEFAQFADQRVSLVNGYPVLSGSPIPDQVAMDGVAFTYQFAANTFSDPNFFDVLQYSARLSDNSQLPNWLNFNALTRTFSGTAPFTIADYSFQIVVTADDVSGDPNSFATDTFTFSVTRAPGPDVNGTAGPDELFGTERVERMFGLEGNDLFFGSSGADQIDGGNGSDTVFYNAFPTGVTVNLATGLGSVGQAEGDTYFSIENVTGSNVNDILIGNAVDNVFNGRGGHDDIDGGAGDGDTAVYEWSRGNYLIEKVTIGSVERIRVTGQGIGTTDGVDLLTGIEFLKFADMTIGTGNNRPVLGAPEIPDQTAGDGVLYSYQIPLGAFTDPDPSDVLSYSATLADGSPLPAWLSFNSATRTFSGTPPLVSIGMVLQVRVTATDNAPSDPASLVSDVFALTTILSPGQDINGTEGPNELFGTERDERMFGLDGNDIFYGSRGADQIDGGNGNDTVRYDAIFNGVTVNLATGLGSGFPQADGDTYISIENVTGSTLGDILTGNADANVLTGNGGIDTLSGGAGNDRLVVSAAGSGTNVNGDADTDTLAVSGEVSLGTVASIEAVELVDGASLTLTGTQFRTGLAANTVFSGAGSLTVNMGAADLELGANTMSVAGGSTIALTVNGSSSGEIIKGLTGAVNTINGGGGADQIRGGAQADFITGGDGNDKLAGGQGADQLTGDAGADQFRFQSSASSGLGVAADRITDFTIGSDLLAFRQIDTDPLTVGDQAFAFIGNNAFGASGAAQMRYANSGADLLVQADINGDGIADMEVLLLGLAGQPLNGSDFLL